MLTELVPVFVTTHSPPVLNYGSYSSALTQSSNGVGAISGIGAVYKGTINTPQAPDTTVSIAFMGATDRRISVVATVVADPQNVAFIYQDADGIINSIQWGAS